MRQFRAATSLNETRKFKQLQLADGCRERSLTFEGEPQPNPPLNALAVKQTLCSEKDFLGRDKHTTR